MEVKKARKINAAIYLPAFIGITIFGIVFLILSIVLTSKGIPSNYVKTEATIVNIVEVPDPTCTLADDYCSPTYEAYVDYTYDGAAYSDVKINYYQSSMKVGDNINIYVNPDNPAEFETKTPNFLFYIFGGSIIAIGVAGVTYQIIRLRKNKKEAI